MTFRRGSNSHERWCALVRDNADLLADLPRGALVRENAFRDYVTRGVHRGVRLSPSVFELSPESLEKLAIFIGHRAQFDMDALLFDDFNEAFRRSHERGGKRGP
jgi:hypothetical protein